MPARLTQLRPMLATSNMTRTIAFYRDKLGFELKGSFGEPPAWCHLERDGVVMMFNAPPSGSVLRDVPPKSRDDQIFYFYPDDVVALHAELAKKRVNLSPLRVTAYGMREFEMRDPDGYWLWFGQPTDDPPTVTEDELKEDYEGVKERTR